MTVTYEAKAVSFVACCVSEAHLVAHVATGDAVPAGLQEHTGRKGPSKHDTQRQP